MNGFGAPSNTYDVRELVFDAAEALKPSFIKIGSQNGPAVTDLEPLVAPLTELADGAHQRGTRVALEPMPFAAVATVPIGA